MLKIIYVQKQPPDVFYKKGVLKNFAKFTGKRLCQSLFFNRVSGLRPATSLKKRLWHRCFCMNFAKFLRTLFYRTLLCDCLGILELLIRYVLIYGEKVRERY